MSDIDGTALTALLVSVVALLVALLQAIQQYASTAYDYRRRSSRVIGSWARRTHRRFIFHEVRFEIAFSTPHITLSLEPPESESESNVDRGSTGGAAGGGNLMEEFGDYDINIKEKHSDDGRGGGGGGGGREGATRDVCLSMNRQKQYVFEPDERYKDSSSGSSTEDELWFLNNDDRTIPEAKSSWLTLLHDTQFTNLYCHIKERRGSYDYMPPGITRPMASMDKLSFLTFMSLRQINWHNRGDDEVLKGVGRRCELRHTGVPGFGPVYTYEHDRTGAGKFLTPLRDDQSGSNSSFRIRYRIASKAAWRAMFNEFDIGFGKIHTHSEAEIAQSLKMPFRGMDVELVDGMAKVMKEERWCPGLGEIIACWNIERSMPKVVRRDDKFLSVFSSHSLTSVLGVPMVVRMLCGSAALPPSRLKFQAIRFVSGWANDLHRRLAEDQESKYDVTAPLLEALKTSLVPRANNLTANDLSWSCSLRCLEAAKVLDEAFDRDLAKWFPEVERNYVARKIAHRQASHGFGVVSEATALTPQKGHTWMDSLDRWMARATMGIVEEVCDDLGIGRGDGNEKVKAVRELTMNRLVRGALWIAHNGNAPGKDTGRRDRLLECSLSHKWLMDRSTVYIA